MAKLPPLLKFLLCSAVAACLWPGSALAGTIFDPNTGVITASVLLNSGSIVGIDVRGLSDLLVSVNGVPVNNVTLGDITGGTDPSAVTLPFGNNVLLGLGTAGISGPIVNLQFDFTTPAFLSGGSVLLLSATSSTGSGNPATDAGLTALLDASPVLFGFGFANTIDLGATGTLYQYNFLTAQGGSAAAVPEPATVELVFAAAILGLCRRYKFRRLS